MAAAFSPAQPAPVKLGAADPVEIWARHTLEGNQACERGEHIRARQSYSEALAVAEDLMVSAARAHDSRAAHYAPTLYGISCNDIIALAIAQNDGLTAGIFLCKLTNGLLSVMESSDAPTSLRARCLLHSRVASAALCAYFEERGMWDAAETYSARANAAFFSVQRLEPRPAARASSALDTAAASPDPSLGLLDSSSALPPADPALLEPHPVLFEPEPPPAPPLAVSSDAGPALAVTPPPRNTLSARLFEWAARWLRLRRAPRVSRKLATSTSRSV